ncbi:MAG: serine esterase [Verrucomicrobiota bacterium]
MLETDFFPAQQKESHRLLILLHGLGDSMEGYRWAPDAMRLPWLNYLFVNAPDTYFSGFSWYDFAGNPTPGIQRSRKMLVELLDGMRRKNFPTNQTIVFGFSQGCLMTLDVGLRYPHLFAGLIGVSGYAHEPEQLLRELSPVAKQQRILITHGTQDTLVPFADVKKQVKLLQAGGLKIDWREFHKAHTIAGEAEFSAIRGFIESCFKNEACS